MQALTAPYYPCTLPSSSSSSCRPFLPAHIASARHPWLGIPLRPSSSLPFRPSCSRSPSFSPSCKVPNVSQDSFQHEVLTSDLPVLVGFCADWCGPCKLIGPIMESVAKEFDGSLKVYKVDTDSSPDLVKEYDVYGLPTLILFKDGKEVPGSRREGTINAKKLKELLNELLASATTT